MTAHWTDRLSEYLDGDLAPAEHAAAEAHLADCAECAALANHLRRVAAHARALPATAPETDLWRGIAPRIGASAPLDLGAHRAARERRRWSFSLPQLAAAAAALIAVTGALTWVVVGRPGAPAPGRESAPAAGAGRVAIAPDTGSAQVAAERGSPARQSAPDRAAAPPAAQVASFGISEYDATIAELEGVLTANRARLEPRTVKIVESNLALIDQAIVQARAALAADPASSYLNAHLASTMRRKVDLLRRLTAIAS